MSRNKVCGVSPFLKAPEARGAPQAQVAGAEACQVETEFFGLSSKLLEMTFTSIPFFVCILFKFCLTFKSRHDALAPATADSIFKSSKIMIFGTGYGYCFLPATLNGGTRTYV